MGEHARLGRSGAGRWTRCPGSVAMLDQLPDSTSPAVVASRRPSFRLRSCWPGSPSIRIVPPKPCSPMTHGFLERNSASTVLPAPFVPSSPRTWQKLSELSLRI